MQLKKDLRAFLSSRIEVQKTVKNELRYSWNGSNVMYRNPGLEYCYSEKKRVEYYSRDKLRRMGAMLLKRDFRKMVLITKLMKAHIYFGILML